jgi:superfamily II DNA/RNA helicase
VLLLHPQEDERELGRVEARIEELSSAKKPPAQSVSAAVEAEEEAATEEEEEDQDEQDEQEGQEGQEKESTTAAAVVAEVAPASPSVSQQPQRALEQTRTPLEVRLCLLKPNGAMLCCCATVVFVRH